MTTLLYLLSLLWAYTGTMAASHVAIAPTFAPPDSLEAVIDLQRSNVLYVGIDNHLELRSNTVNVQELELTANKTSCTLIKQTDGKYVVHCSRVGPVLFTIQAPKTGKRARYCYFVKRIGDPVTQLGKYSKNGILSAGEFKAQLGLLVRITGMEMDAQCQVLEFTLFYQNQNNDPIELRNRGGRFQGAVRNAVMSAKAGDRYIFTNVQARCPGAPAGRQLNSLIFTIR